MLTVHVAAPLALFGLALMELQSDRRAALVTLWDAVLSLLSAVALSFSCAAAAVRTFCHRL